MFLLILKYIAALRPNVPREPIIRGSFMENGLMTSLSLYPIKYLNEFFVPYGSYLEANILLTSVSSILVTFLFL